MLSVSPNGTIGTLLRFVDDRRDRLVTQNAFGEGVIGEICGVVFSAI